MPPNLPGDGRGLASATALAGQEASQEMQKPANPALLKLLEMIKMMEPSNIPDSRHPNRANHTAQLARFYNVPFDEMDKLLSESRTKYAAGLMGAQEAANYGPQGTPATQSLARGVDLQLFLEGQSDYLKGEDPFFGGTPARPVDPLEQEAASLGVDPRSVKSSLPRPK